MRTNYAALLNKLAKPRTFVSKPQPLAGLRGKCNPRGTTAEFGAYLLEVIIAIELYLTG